MKIYFDNVDFYSNSGPNGFGQKLFKSLKSLGHQPINHLVDRETKDIDIQLSFIYSNIVSGPVIQRLDGIYFNSEQDFKSLNEPIKRTYENCQGVVFQSSFNKSLTEKWFGEHDNSAIIRNGTNLDLIDSISPLYNDKIDSFEKVWCCASSWRPHKRLSENVRYFLDFASEKDCLVIAGSNPDYSISHPRIFYAGNLDWKSLISLFRRSDYFIHLAWLDHCPNVVVDARASGCHIICSSSGGTKEICGSNSTIIEEDNWDYSPCKLYSPPPMDFSNTSNTIEENSINIKDVSKIYLDFFRKTIEGSM